MPTVDSQVVAIKTANPDIFINIGTPKFAAQAIKKVAEMNWHPIHIMTNVSISPGQVMKPAGYENSQGILSSSYQMIVTDPGIEATPGMKRFRAFMEKYYPEADKTESGALTAWNASNVLVEVLKQVRRQSDPRQRDEAGRQPRHDGRHLSARRPRQDLADGFSPIEQLQMIQFKGDKWEVFGPLIDSHQE